eukprot:CAMPEP_0113899216 /NCGR_PEP_ID=MMETSP0780_2-20120614/19878_1 /TAXON_ID=652834 /ORGANISM="Palpitomonas bilix" /LENGTH=793 /DNA_ID=CAMNT_0000891299 /DNA_START=97 /DNA_END=2478 /DNA_ORIENTATION=+ /assembly_acc=CAM_ASM_000599
MERTVIALALLFTVLFAGAKSQSVPCECHVDPYSCLAESSIDPSGCTACGWCNGVCTSFAYSGGQGKPKALPWIGGTFTIFNGSCEASLAYNCSSGLVAQGTNVTETVQEFTLTSVGVLMAICGNLVTSVSLSLQKYIHNKIEKEQEGKKEGEKVRPYYCNWRWWLALIMMLGGELGNAGAYSIAPASTISPVGGVSVVGSTIIAIAWLKEKFRWIDLIGLTCVVGGVILVILFGPTSNKTLTIESFRYLYFLQFPFVIYLSACLVLVLILFLVARKYAEKHILILIAICAICGSIAVADMKAFITFLIGSFNGESAFVYADFYVLAVFGGFMGFMQIRHLNASMQLFGNLQTVPIYYTCFTVFTIITANVLFNEFGCGDNCPHAPCIILFAIGCVMGFIGVFLVSAKSGGFLLRSKGTKWADNPVVTEETARKIRRNTQIFIGKLPIAALRRRSMLALQRYDDEDKKKAEEKAKEMEGKEVDSEVEVEVEVVVEEDDAGADVDVEMADLGLRSRKVGAYESPRRSPGFISRQNSARLPHDAYDGIFGMFKRRRTHSTDKRGHQKAPSVGSDDLYRERKLRIKEVRIKQMSFDFDRDIDARHLVDEIVKDIDERAVAQPPKRKPTHRRVSSLPVHAESVILEEISRTDLQRRLRNIADGGTPLTPARVSADIVRDHGIPTPLRVQNTNESGSMREYETECVSPTQAPVSTFPLGPSAMSPVSERADEEESIAIDPSSLSLSLEASVSEGMGRQRIEEKQQETKADEMCEHPERADRAAADFKSVEEKTEDNSE